VGNTASSDSSSAFDASDGERTISLGTGSQAIANDSVALGSGCITDRANTISVGTAGNERQIANVASGTVGADAVNLNQLQARWRPPMPTSTIAKRPSATT
jgi:autotransporter adhesin